MCHIFEKRDQKCSTVITRSDEQQAQHFINTKNICTKVREKKYATIQKQEKMSWLSISKLLHFIQLQATINN